MEGEVSGLTTLEAVLRENQEMKQTLMKLQQYNEHLIRQNDALVKQINSMTQRDSSLSSSTLCSSDADTEMEVEKDKDLDKEYPKLGQKVQRKKRNGSNGSASSATAAKKAKPKTTNEEKALAPVIKAGPSKVSTTPKKQQAPAKSGGKKAAPPAIVVFSKEHKKLQSSIKAVTGNQHTTLKIQGERTRVQTASKEDFIKVKEHLKEEKVEMFTYTPRDEKPFTMVIKNISVDYSAEEIKDALEEQINENILSVRHLARNNWIIQVVSNEIKKKIQGLRYALGYKIAVEGFRGQKVLQCKNCQRYNHLAVNCGMTYRCVKCSKGHGPSKCCIPKKEENNKVQVVECPDGSKKTTVGMPLKCANCGGQHAASYRGCKERKRVVAQRAKPAPKPTPVRRNHIVTNFVRKDVPYSQVAAVGVQQTAPKPTLKQQVAQPATSSQKFDIDAEFQAIFGRDLLGCFEKVSTHIPHIKGAKDHSQKAKALVTLLVDLYD
jgi:hypothetical protein